MSACNHTSGCRRHPSARPNSEPPPQNQPYFAASDMLKKKKKLFGLARVLSKAAKRWHGNHQLFTSPGTTPPAMRDREGQAAAVQQRKCTQHW